MECSVISSDKLSKNHADTNWFNHIEQLYRVAGEFSRSIERQKQIDELVRDGLDRNIASAVVDL